MMTITVSLCKRISLYIGLFFLGLLDVTAQAQKTGLLVPQHHRLDVTALAFSPNGKQLLSASIDYAVKLCDASTGVTLFNFIMPDYRINAVAFSPNGKQFVSGADNGLVNVWEARNGKLLYQLNAGASVTSLVFSPNGKWLITGGEDGFTRYWSTKTGKEAYALQQRPWIVSALSVSPDGKYLLIGNAQGEIEYRELSTRKLIKTIKTKGRLFYLAFAPDGKRFLSAGRGKGRSNYGYLGIWELASGKEVQTFSQTDNAYYGNITYYLQAAAFSPDGSKVVASTATSEGKFDNSFAMWDTHTGELVFTFRDEEKPAQIKAFAFSPSSKVVVAGSSDSGIRAVWAKNGALLANHHGHHYNDYAMALGVNCLDVSPDGKSIITGSWDNHLRLWKFDKQSQTVPTLLEGRGKSYVVQDVCFSPKGDKIASCGTDNEVKLWRTSDGALLKTSAWQKRDVNTVAFSSDGKLVISGANDRYAKIWKVVGKWAKASKTFGEAWYVDVVGFLPDGKRIFTATNRGTLIEHIDSSQFNTKSYHILRHSDLTDVVCLPNGKQMISISEQTLKLWDIATREELQTITLEGASSPQLALARDGNWLTAKVNSHQVTTWRVKNKSLVLHRAIKLPPDIYIIDVAISPNGHRLLVGCHDNTVRIFSTRSGKLLATLYTRFAKTDAWLVLTPQGKYDGNEAGLANLFYKKSNGEITYVLPSKKRKKGLLGKVMKE